MAEAYPEELKQIMEVAESGMYGGISMKKKIARLLENYKGEVKSIKQVRRELSKIKGSLATEVIETRKAE